MSTDLHKRQATAALEERSKLIAELRTIEADNKMTAAEKRERVEKIDRDVMQLEAEAREAVECGEREAEVRSLAGRQAGFLTPGNGPSDPDEWRALMPSLNEYRALIAEGTPSAGGYTVPSKTSAQYVDVLKAQSTFLRALPAGNVLPFNTDTLQVPQLIESDGEDYRGEGESFPRAR
ncbi:phage major capsid protein [Streptomyces sp. GD-15H]